MPEDGANVSPRAREPKSPKGALIGKRSYTQLEREADGGEPQQQEQQQRQQQRKEQHAVPGAPSSRGSRLGRSAYAQLEEVELAAPNGSSAPARELSLGQPGARGGGGGCAGCCLAALTLNAAMGGFLFGYDTGVVSGAMLEIRTARQGLGNLTSAEQEAIVSSTIAGAIVGSLLSGEAQKRFWMGRRTVIVAGSVLFMVGAVFMGAAWDVASLTAGRVVVGLAVGIVSQAVPLYISECAPARLRGGLSAVNTIMIVLGQVVASLVCCFFARRGTPQGWRWMLGLGALPAVFMSLGFLAMPESPRYLLLSGRGSDAALQQAEAVLLRLRSGSDAQGVGEELRATLRAVTEAEGGGSGGLLQVLGTRGTRRALLLGCSLQLLQQLCGVNTLMYYSATILRMSSEQASAQCGRKVPGKLQEPAAEAAAGVYEICMTALVALSQVLGTLVGMALVDRSGRRPLVLGSLVGVALSLFVLGAAFHPGGLQAEEAPVWAMVLYLFCFGVGMAPLPWTVNAEIYPLNVRSTCLGIATAANWVANFLVAATFLDLAEALSTDRSCPRAHPDGAFWLYGGFAVAGLVGLGVWMPETKGLTLEEISAVFEGKPKEKPPPACESSAALGDAGEAGPPAA